MRQKSAALALLCLFGLSACAEFEDSKKESSGQELVSAENFDDLIRVAVEPTSKAERYMIYWSWPKLGPDFRMRLRQQQTLAVLRNDQTTFSHEVDHNQSLSYTFEVIDSQGVVQNSHSKLVQVPKDFVVREGSNVLNEKTKIFVKRIFFAQHPLITNGHEVNIYADELIAERGVIETFPKESKAQASIDGASAGRIQIYVGVATGTMNIVMRGQNGGDGNPGPAYTNRAADGAAPRNGSLDCDPDPRPPRGDLRLSVGPVLAGRCWCDRIGDGGGNGAAGVKGLRGGRAGHGGDTGELKFEIKDGSAFLLTTESIPGNEGTPGKGGPGQPGGIALENKSSCAGPRGANGPAGPQGDDGEKGEVGKKGLICVFVASEGKNDCY